MKICIAGKNNISIEILSFFIKECSFPKENIFVILNKTDNFIDSWQRSLGRYAKENNIKIVKLKDVYDIEDLVFLSLEFDKIIRTKKFITKNIYNIHFSLLPKYKGMFTSILPILNNDSYTGVTLHKIDDGIDTGDIIAQKSFPIDYNDNARDVYFKYLKNGIDLIKNNCKIFLENKFFISQPQDIYKSQYFSRNAINFSDITINLNQVAINIYNQIRAFSFREYQMPEVFGQKIISSKILDNKSNIRSGKIIFENEIAFVISTIDNDIVLYKDKYKDFIIACKEGDLDVINKFVQIPKIINIQDDKGFTPLILAISNDNIDVAKILLVNGANISISDFRGETPLMYAKNSYISSGKSDILELIVNLGVDIYQNDYKNKNVLDYCKENNEEKAIEIIMN